MKIILASYALKYPLTGIGWYTHCLLSGLQLHDEVSQLICVPSVSGHYAYTCIKERYFQLAKKLLRSLPYSYTCVHSYRNYSFKKKIDKSFIYHEPCYILRPYYGLKICNVHDLSHIYYPENHPRERVKFLSRYLPTSLVCASHIITGSYFIRDELVNIFKIPRTKITTIYHGVSSDFKPRKLNEINNILVRYGLLGKTYILSVGTLEPRKNLERLIQAFTRLPKQQKKKFPLVLVGIKGWGTRRLMKLIKELIKKEELYCLGYVPIEDLPYLYSGAHGFVYLSLYEGFGLPLLEALASGIPTLTSNTSSMPEVVGDAALLVNPWNVEAIADKLNQLLVDNFLRDKLKYKGPIQAAQFSWQKCVNETVNVYKQVLASVS